MPNQIAEKYVRNGNAFMSSADDHGRSVRPAIEWQGHNVTVYRTEKPNTYLTSSGDWEV